MTPAHSRCFPGAKSHLRTNDFASVSLRLCGAKSDRLPSPLHWLHPRKQIPLTPPSPPSLPPLPSQIPSASVDQMPPARCPAPSVTSALLAIQPAQSPRSSRQSAGKPLAASSTSRYLGAGCNSAGALTDSQGRPGNSAGKLAPPAALARYAANSVS